MDESRTNVTFFPISFFPQILETKRPELQDSFLLDDEIKAGWIGYNPNTVTVITCNDMLRPFYAPPSIVNDAEQILKVKTREDLKIMTEMLSKPLLMCVTRRQDDHAMIMGFDMDFILVFESTSGVLAKMFKHVTDSISEKLETGDKFCFTVDIAQTLDELTPKEYRNNVTWFNTSICFTNHSRPNPVLSLEPSCVWCMLMPCCFLASIPYRMCRNFCGEDRDVDLKVKLSLESCPRSPLILFFYEASRPQPGKYLKHGKYFIARIWPTSELSSLLYLMD